MKQVYADTWFWIALLSPSDNGHKVAKELKEDLSDAKLVTTDEVLVEFVTYFCEWGSHWRRAAARFARDVLSDAGTEVVEQSRSSFHAGLRYYESREDKRYGMVDCISMGLMRSRNITEVLTNDEHFREDGFALIPSVP